MEGGIKKVILYSGVFGVIFMTIFLLVLFIKKFQKKNVYPIQKIAWKKLPGLKSIPLNVQLQSKEKFKSSVESFSSIDSEFSTIKERRDDMIDPLLGVLHTSRQTKARLSETQDLQYRKPPKTVRQPPQHEKKIKKVEKKIISENTLILETALVWATNDKSLTIMMPNVESLLSKNVKTFLTVKIESVHKAEKNISKFEDKKECQSKNGLIFCFKGMTLEEAQSCYIRLEVSERKHRLSKEHILSRGILSLKKNVLVPNTPLNLHSQLTVLKDVRNKSGSSQEQIFGTLWISLRCCFVGQVSANFILDIKRAENLPLLKSGGSYRTEVFLVRKEKKLQYFCSTSRHGHSPEWNSSFTFDVSINNISDYSLEFITLKMGKLSGSKRIGKCSLIDGGIKSKSSFWEDVIENIGEEILYKRELQNPSDQDVLPFIDDKLLGQLSLTLSESTNFTLRDKISELKLTPNYLASFQFDKSGGEYKLEIVVQEKDRSLFQFTTMTSQSDSLHWVSPHSFKVMSDKISNLNLSVTLIRQGRLKKSTKLGRTIIGEKVFGEWKETASNSPSTEWFPMYRFIFDRVKIFTIY
ncbi:UNVERIFIED_CONTAM: hypothetical protein RMT77_006471 [Armadillidium vulgare]